MQKRRKKAKPIKQPTDIEKYYRVQLRSLVRAVRREIDAQVMPVIKQEKNAYTADASWSERINSAIDRVIDIFASDRYRTLMERLAGTVVERTERQATESFVSSVGVDIRPLLGSMEDFIRMNTQNNASLIKSIPDRYLESVRQIVISGTLNGLSPTQIQRQIVEQTGIADKRALTLARDQVSRLTGQIQEKRQTQAGITHYRVSTAGDMRVSGRPGGLYPNAKISCWGISKKDVGNGPGVYSWKEGASWGGEKGLHPGSHHINCFPAGTLVHASEVKAATSRWFEGDMVVVRTASGKELSATPNHPILTRRGWVGAGELTESDNVVCPVGAEVGGMLNPDDYDVVSSIEDVADSLFVSRGVIPVEMEVSAPYFHGDGTDGEVCVMYADSFLNSNLDAFRNESVKHKSFVRAFDGFVSLFRERCKSFFSIGALPPLGCPVSGSNLIFSGLFAHARPFEGLGLGLISYRYHVFGQNAPDNVAGNTKPFGGSILGEAARVTGDDIGFRVLNNGIIDGLDASGSDNSSDDVIGDAELARQILDCAPAGVFLDKVVSVVVHKSVKCHVYNLETGSGAYVAEGILTHNCRCTATPVMPWELDD